MGCRSQKGSDLGGQVDASLALTACSEPRVPVYVCPLPSSKASKQRCRSLTISLHRTAIGPSNECGQASQGGLLRPVCRGRGGTLDDPQLQKASGRPSALRIVDAGADMPCGGCCWASRQTRHRPTTGPGTVVPLPALSHSLVAPTPHRPTTATHAGDLRQPPERPAAQLQRRRCRLSPAGRRRQRQGGRGRRPRTRRPAVAGARQQVDQT